MEEFATKDLYLASFLVSKGSPLRSSTREDGITMFRFKNVIFFAKYLGHGATHYTRVINGKYARFVIVISHYYPLHLLFGGKAGYIRKSLNRICIYS